MRRMMLLVVAATTGLSACADRLPITRAPVEVLPKAEGAVGRDVLAGSRARAQTRLAFAGTETIAVRARFGRTELDGARCRADADYFTAEITTPGFLVVPDYGPRSSDIRLRCQFGEMRGSGLIRMTDTRDTDEKSRISLGTGGVGVRLVIPLTRVDQAQIYEYPDAVIRLK